jgi:methylated-DNA-[protein]-cysteine S-methyltransferase
MKFFSDTFATPLGLFSVAVNRDGEVVATAFGNDARLRSRLRSGELVRDQAVCAEARKQLAGYFAGARRRFDLRLSSSGTDFQCRVWTALQGIPYGETRTYGQLAAEIGNAAASRAVGRANATNPVCVIVPCHRVIGADGSLTGFAFGEKTKLRLLELERKHARQPSPVFS